MNQVANLASFFSSSLIMDVFTNSLQIHVNTWGKRTLFTEKKKFVKSTTFYQCIPNHNFVYYLCKYQLMVVTFSDLMAIVYIG